MGDVNWLLITVMVTYATWAAHDVAKLWLRVAHITDDEWEALEERIDAIERDAGVGDE